MSRAMAFEHQPGTTKLNSYASNPVFVQYRAQEDEEFAKEQLIELERKTHQAEMQLPGYPLGNVPAVLPACGRGELQPHNVSVQRFSPDGSMGATQWTYDADFTREACQTTVHVHLLRVPQALDTGSEQTIASIKQ